MMTPLMKQYWEIKEQHQDKVLLFRMGDFYEMFHQDAITAAPILNIALTQRNKKSQDETPMCGVPHHSIASPIGKLLQAGHKVAICDQLEDPETAKGIVKRGVTRILSPGMVYDPETLNELQANYLCAFNESKISFLDVSTGEAFSYKTAPGVVGQKTRDQLLALLRPVELVVTTQQKTELFKNLETGSLFIAGEAVHLTTFDRSETEPSDRLKAYAVAMQGEAVLSILKPFEERSLSSQMPLGETVIRHLEIFKTTKGDDKGSLFHALNRTKTSAGARLLKSWLQFPLIEAKSIEARQEKVEKWTKSLGELKSLRQALQGMGDIERRMSKIPSSNCNVHDLVALESSLSTGLALARLSPDLEREISAENCRSIAELAAGIRNTLVDEPPLQTKAGGFIRREHSQEFDELVTLAEESQKLLLELETREKEKTGISSLKVRYNSVFGYYIEITNTHSDKVPDHYKRKQTLANAERFMTQELMELETKILSARAKRVEYEERVFQDLKKQILACAAEIRRATQVWSELDVVSSLAWLAIENKYVRPTFGETLNIQASRHPVIEQEVRSRFVANDIRLERGSCLLLTGPNMAGKSTLMRQVAVTALMAQMGSFVPAKKAEMPVFTRIFTRIGASDSLSEGLSTFMVEMKETAEMVSEADASSLVILDEVGRGTSTYDGMSLARAILEYLVKDKKPLVFFATHYHELTQLESEFAVIRNAHMEIEEKAASKEIRFLYTLSSGPANKSYGLHVAQLAGLPASLLKRAEDLLGSYEGSSVSRPEPRAFDDLPLFNQPVVPAHFKVLLEELKEIELSGMTPLAALNKISEWQQRLS